VISLVVTGGTSVVNFKAGIFLFLEDTSLKGSSASKVIGLHFDDGLTANLVSEGRI
jgi:hypothetical protein